VRLEILRRIERLNLTAASAAVQAHFAREESPLVHETALRTLAMVGGPQTFNQVAAYLDHPNLNFRRGALIGLFHNGGIEGVLAAGQHLLVLTTSSQAAEQALAAEVLGQIGVASFYQPLLKLLTAPEPEVRRAALVAAGQVKSPQLWPLVVEALDSPEFSAEAATALVAGGLAVVPALDEALAQPTRSRTWRLRAVRVCARLRGEAVVSLLRRQLVQPDPEIRTETLRALSANSYRASGEAAESVQREIRTEAERVTQTLAALVEIEDMLSFDLLAGALTAQIRLSQTRLLLWLSFLYDAEAIRRVEGALTSTATRRAYALESLDLLLPQALKSIVLPILDDLPPPERLRRLSGVFPQPQLSPEQRLPMLIHEAESTWLRACALHTVGCLALTACLPAVRASLDALEPLIRETASWTLARLESKQKETKGMLSTIEKVIILKTITIFAEMDDAVLADLARLVEEVEVKAGEVIFEKGDPGNSLYLVVTGQVRVYDGGRTLSYLGERALFGEMALLDAQPRLASAKAVEDSLLFRLRQEPFYEMLADHSGVARQIIQLLSKRLRECVQDLAGLSARLNTPNSAAAHDSTVFDTLPRLRKE
jgi:CRP-like cAMP-binding protein